MAPNATNIDTHKNNQSSARQNMQKKQPNTSVINLSSRILTQIELKVLELGLSFCPSVKEFNKDQLTIDFCNFIRKLKLKEFFHQDENSENSDSNNNRTEDIDLDQCDLP